MAPDQLSLVIGKGGQNVRLAAKLTGWKLDIVTPERERATAKPEEGISSEQSDGKNHSEDIEVSAVGS